MNKRDSLMIKIPFLVSAVIFVLGVFATVIVYYFSVDQVIDNEKDNLITISQKQTEKTNEVIKCSISVVETISKNNDIANYIASFDGNYQEEEILNLLELYNIGDKYSAVYILNSKGDTLASTAESFVGKNYSFRDYFSTALTGNSFVDVSIGVTSGKLGYYFASPVMKNNESVGVAVVKLNPEYIHDTININEQRAELNTMFVDEYGVIIFSSDENREYKSLGELTELDEIEIKEKKRYADKEIHPLSYTAIQDRIDTTNETALYEIYDDLDGEEEIITISKVGDSNFFIVVEGHTEDLVEDASLTGFYLGLLVFFSSIAAAVMTLIILRESLKPLKELTKGVDEISSGNYEYKIELDKKDEFGSLAMTLNKMSKRVKESRENIEGKVQERTEKLEKINSLMVGREKKMIELKKEIKKLNGEKK
jgi:C4-dicarboxylate-specific signal transduction histidine kinase